MPFISFDGHFDEAVDGMSCVFGAPATYRQSIMKSLTDKGYTFSEKPKLLLAKM